MPCRHCPPALVWAGIAVFALAGCSRAARPAPVEVRPPVEAPVPVDTHMTIAASADVNPDSTGRPSPIVVRVYQLRGNVAFAGSDFFALYDDEEKALGSDLISRTEFELAPAEHRRVDVTISTEARFVGAIAAFRDIRNAEWRALAPASGKRITNTARQDALTVAVERARVVLSVAE